MSQGVRSTRGLYQASHYGPDNNLYYFMTMSLLPFCFCVRNFLHLKYPKGIETISSLFFQIHNISAKACQIFRKFSIFDYLAGNLVYLAGSLSYLASSLSYLAVSLVYLASIFYYLAGSLAYLASSLAYLAGSLVYLSGSFVFLAGIEPSIGLNFTSLW